MEALVTSARATPGWTADPTAAAAAANSCLLRVLTTCPGQLSSMLLSRNIESYKDAGSKTLLYLYFANEETEAQ